MDSVFITINQWMTSGSYIAAIGCFLWGVVSVLFSPCHIASIPLIVAYVGGQDKVVNPRQASIYSVLFTTGLFITIAVIGFVCALLGRMLGDVGEWFQVFVGVVLIWAALGMLGVEACSLPGNFTGKFKVKGKSGAFLLGLAYGILSGSCTFGFIAPILAIITVQTKILTGIIFILLFALGHCLPIVIAGSSMALVRKVVENQNLQNTGLWFRKGAGVVIFILGVYFIVNPFIERYFA